MNDEGVGRQSGRSRQVGSRQRRPLACHLVGNCTQLTTKSQPTNLRHSGILVPSSFTRVELDDFSAQTNQFHGISLAGSGCVGVVQSCVRHFYASTHARAVSSGTCQPSYICSCTVHRFGHIAQSTYILYVHKLHVHNVDSTFLFS